MTPAALGLTSVRGNVSAEALPSGARLETWNVYDLRAHFGFEEIAPYEGREFAAVPDAEEIQVFMALDLARDDTFRPRRQRRT